MTDTTPDTNVTLAPVVEAKPKVNRKAQLSALRTRAGRGLLTGASVTGRSVAAAWHTAFGLMDRVPEGVCAVGKTAVKLASESYAKKS